MLLRKVLFLSLIAISPLFAQDFLSLDGTSSHIDDPNCWNGALYGAGVINSRRFMNPEEWLNLLKLNCHEVKEPVSGSVGRLYTEKNEVHGFIYLTDTLIFAKHGMAKKDGYMLMSFDDMMEQYGKTRNCRIHNSDAPECYHLLKYYNCESSPEMRLSIRKMSMNLEELVFSPETKKVFRETCEDSSFLRRNELLKEMIRDLQALENEIASNPLSELERSIIDSFITQVYEVEISNRYFKCSDRRLKSESIRKVRKLLKAILTK